MGQKLDAAAAANAIRNDMRQPSPEDRHTESFVRDVLSQLGLEFSVANAMMVGQALHRHDIEPHRAQEYPKHVQNHAGDTVTVHDEDEERRAQEPPADEPADSGAEPVDEQLPDEPEYPKTVMRRGTDGQDHPVLVRDLKEERELLGLDDQPIDPAAPRQSDQADLPEVSQEELDRKRAVSSGAELERRGIDQVNQPKAPLRPMAAPSRAPGPKPAGRPPIKE